MKRPLTELTEDLGRMVGSLGMALANPEFRKHLDSLIDTIKDLRSAMETLEGVSPQRGNNVEDWDKYAADVREAQEDQYR